MVATAPETGDLALRSEHPWPVDDPRCSGIGHGDFDHIDAEERRAVIALAVEAAGQFLVLPDEGRARTVDDDPAIARIDHRMGMASAAGLHLADLARQRKVGNVEDPDTAEALVADLLGYALQAAVGAPARFFHAHDQEFADDRDVALPAGADRRADQLRHPVGAEAVGIEAVVAPRDHDAVGKSHVGVGEIEQCAALGEVGLGRLFAFLERLRFPGLLARLRCLERLELGRIGGIEEARRLGQRCHAAQVADRLSGIGNARRERGARIA